MLEFIPLSLGYRLVRDLWSFVFRQKILPEEILEARKRWQPEFSEQIYKHWKDDLRKDVTVVDVQRIPEYETNTKRPFWKRASPYFKVGLVQSTSDDIALMLDIAYIKFGGSSLVEVRYDDESDGVWPAPSRWPDH